MQIALMVQKVLPDVSMEVNEMVHEPIVSNYVHRYKDHMQTKAIERTQCYCFGIGPIILSRNGSWFQSFEKIM